MTTTTTNSTARIKKIQERCVNRDDAPAKFGALFLSILVLSITLKGIAQAPAVRFIDADGKTIAEVSAHHQDEQVYLPVDTVKQVIDPRATHQYNHPRKRLTLKTKGRQIRLQMGKSVISIEPDGQTLTLATPPITLAQQPMLPVDFFIQLLPIFNNVEVIYNANLNRLQIRSKRTWAPIATDNTQSWTIIVDPGHGGPDHGCASSTGRLEKDIVLAVAKQLQERLKQQGIQVHLTRETDAQKTHFERIQIAKQNRGQLFLSLHCDTSFSPHEKGIRIYLNNPKGRILFPNITKPALIGQQLKVLAQVNFLKQSQDFAHALQTELNFLTETPIEIIDLPLIALSEAYMPAVILELGYLSNVEDLAKLSDAEYTASVVEAITRALQRYISSIHRHAAPTVPEE